MELGDRVAVVTGGASGLGLACVQRLVQEGAIVAAIDANPSALGALSATGVRGWQCDVSDPDAMEAAFDQIRSQLGRTSILINCAGIATPGSVIRKGAPMPLEEFRRVIEVNVLGTINAVRCAAAQMIEAFGDDPDAPETGVIVNTTSIAATDGQVGQAAYSASKGAVASMILPLARELGEYRIRINGISPGVFATPMTLSLPEKSQQVIFSAKPPCPARAGLPHEFADLAAYLVTQSFINGTVVRLDGGLRMPARY